MNRAQNLKRGIWTLFGDQIPLRRGKKRTKLPSYTFCIFIYIYIHTCCEVIIWSKFGGFKGYYLVQVGVIIWSKFVFLPIFFVVSSDFLHTQLLLCVFCAQLSGNFLKIAFSKKKCKNWVFQFSVF